MCCASGKAIAMDVAMGLHYLHNKQPDPVVHFDVKVGCSGLQPRHPCMELSLCLWHEAQTELSSMIALLRHACL